MQLNDGILVDFPWLKLTFTRTSTYSRAALAQILPWCYLSVGKTSIFFFLVSWHIKRVNKHPVVHGGAWSTAKLTHTVALSNMEHLHPLLHRKDRGEEMKTQEESHEVNKKKTRTGEEEQKGVGCLIDYSKAFSALIWCSDLVYLTHVTSVCLIKSWVKILKHCLLWQHHHFCYLS